MEECPQSSMKFDDCIDTNDSDYLCGLSTILVANIQELKDRISQIEFIFCSQLFPNFQSRSKSLQIKLLEARKAMNDEWKKRETSLLDQIKVLQFEKQCAREEVERLNVSLQETKARLLISEEKLSKCEDERLQRSTKVENSDKYDETIANLKEQLGQKSEELAEGKKLQEKLLQQIDVKDHNLMVEQSKRKGLYEEFIKFKDSYKHLKSQYTFLLGKLRDRNDTEWHQDLLSSNLNKRSPQDSEHKSREISHLTSVPIEMKNDEGSLQKKLSRNQDNSCINQPSTSIALPPKHASTNTKTEPFTGMKRSTSSWRGTRMREEPGGADLHDDFLDTPMEMAKNLNMAPCKEVQDLPIDFNISDDETQEIVKPGSVLKKQNVSVIGTATDKGFKFAESVRKKNERENLRGVECKQCKKFYDAVLPADDNKSDGQKSMRCEHHDGVSRHRYRFAPPLTPEGFWNIGFESEM